MLKTWKLTEEGTYIDDEKINEVSLGRYSLNASDYISVRIGIKDDAEKKGGINLFGDSFGDYAHGVRMAIYYEDGK